jgi:hypothetical protein
MLELHVYDFDGTLFDSPLPPDDWSKGMGTWFESPGSLLPPCVPEHPGSEWWNGDVVASAKQSIANPNVFAIMMTGRTNQVGLRYRIAELLDSAGLDFDAVYLKKGFTSTPDFKAHMLGKILRRFPDISLVKIWDDRHNHLPIFSEVIEGMGISVETYPVNYFSNPAGCNTEEMNEALGRKDYANVYKTAAQAHRGQTRRSGEPYFSHPSSVRNIVRRYYPNDKIAQLAALLHDTLEDAPKIGTVKSLEEMEEKILNAIGNQDIAYEVLETVRQVTHESGDYTSYIVGLLSKPRALRVKLSDMEHNLQTAGTRQRDKYSTAITAVANITDGAPPTGISARHWKKILKMIQPAELREVRDLVKRFLLESSSIRQFVRGVLSESVGDSEHIFMNDLDPTMPVIILYPNSPKYEFFKDYFKNTHAFNWLEKNVMFVDGHAVEQGWFTEDHLLVMQAHELGHKVAGHIEKQQVDHRDPVLEREADWVGYNILKNRGYDSAAGLHETEFEIRYGVKPDAVAGEMVHLMDVIQ